MDKLRRRILLGFGAVPLVAIAQAPVVGAKKRLGVLYFPSRQVIESLPHDSSAYVSFGWIEGRTLEKVKRYADFDGSRFEPLARELVAARPDVHRAAGVPCTRAMQKATRTIPICAIVDDPVGNGFAKSMARPGGNITGLCEGYAESSEKMIALLRAAMPGLSRLAIVSTSRDAATLEGTSQWLVKAAAAAGIAVGIHAPGSKAEIESIIQGLPPGKGALFLKWVDEKTAQGMARLATPRRVALVGQDIDLVDHGALMAYTPVVAEERQLVAMLDRLLRGGNPAEIPFELPTRAIFVINRKAASAIGLRFPADFNVMADRIVD